MSESKLSNVGQIVSFAVVVESLITYSKDFFVGGKVHWQMIISICIGIIISIAYNLDLPSKFGAETKLKWVGNIITGIIISRGSNYLWDLITAISAQK